MMRQNENEKVRNEIDNLLVRCLNGTADKVEYDRAWRWSTQSSENRQHYRELFSILIASNLLNPVDPEIKDNVWIRIGNETGLFGKQKKSIRTVFFKWVSVAAVIAVVCVFGTQKWWSKEKDELHTITTGINEKKIIELNDGTKVWINGETTLGYAESFGKKSRDVELSGEAYFQVNRHEKKPFIVKTSDLNIEVLGTQFNVRAISNESSICATVEEGSVKIVNNNQIEKGVEEILVSGQQLLFDKLTGDKLLRNVNSRLYTAWREGRVSFDHEQIKCIFAFLEQNYQVTISLKNQQIAERRYTGRFTLDVKPDKILRLIQQSIPFDFYIRNDTIHIE